MSPIDVFTNEVINSYSDEASNEKDKEIDKFVNSFFDYGGLNFAAHSSKRTGEEFADGRDIKIARLSSNLSEQKDLTRLRSENPAEFQEFMQEIMDNPELFRKYLKQIQDSPFYEEYSNQIINHPLFAEITLENILKLPEDVFGSDGSELINTDLQIDYDSLGMNTTTTTTTTTVEADTATTETNSLEAFTTFDPTLLESVSPKYFDELPAGRYSLIDLLKTEEDYHSDLKSNLFQHVKLFILNNYLNSAQIITYSKGLVRYEIENLFVIKQDNNNITVRSVEQLDFNKEDLIKKITSANDYSKCYEVEANEFRLKLKHRFELFSVMTKKLNLLYGKTEGTLFSKEIRDTINTLIKDTKKTSFFLSAKRKFSSLIEKSKVESGFSYNINFSYDEE